MKYGNFVVVNGLIEEILTVVIIVVKNEK